MNTTWARLVLFRLPGNVHFPAIEPVTWTDTGAPSLAAPVSRSFAFRSHTFSQVYCVVDIRER